MEFDRIACGVGILLRVKQRIIIALCCWTVRNPRLMRADGKGATCELDVTKRDMQQNFYKMLCPSPQLVM